LHEGRAERTALDTARPAVLLHTITRSTAQQRVQRTVSLLITARLPPSLMRVADSLTVVDTNCRARARSTRLQTLHCTGRLCGRQHSCVGPPYYPVVHRGGRKTPYSNTVNQTDSASPEASLYLFLGLVSYKCRLATPTRSQPADSTSSKLRCGYTKQKRWRCTERRPWLLRAVEANLRGDAGRRCKL
jgi:hypothetical protein